MSRWNADSDLDYYDEFWQPRPNATCTDCGAGFVKHPADVGMLCDPCCSRRDEHTSAVEIRMAKAHLRVKEMAAGVIEVELIPVGTNCTGPVVDVALVPAGDRDTRVLKRMAKAMLAADLTTIKDVA